jgi:hypothetical protein
MTGKAGTTSPLSNKSHLMRFAFFILCLVLVGCAHQNPDCGALVSKIHNDHIRWDGTYFGLQVSSMGDAEQRVLQSGPMCRPFLIAALADESRFVAAHVLLTQMQPGSVPISSAEWNHLEVTLDPEGRAEIPVEQKTEIQALWTGN